MADLAAAWRRRTVPATLAATASGLAGPQDAMTVADNFRFHILPTIGTRPADRVGGLDLDDRYESLYDDKGLSPEVIARCHGQVRAMFNWAIRKKLVVC